MIRFKREPVGTQAVIVELLKVECGFSSIVNDHAALLEQRHLLCMSNSRLAEGSHHCATPRKRGTRQFEDALVRIALAGFITSNFTWLLQNVNLFIRCTHQKG